MDGFTDQGAVGIGFIVTAAIATIVSIVLVVRHLNLSLSRVMFLEQIEKLVRAENVDRAAKLSMAHDGPVCMLCRVAMREMAHGRAFSLQSNLQTEAAQQVARVVWLGWPTRIVGLAAIGLGSLMLLRMPHDEPNRAFQFTAVWLTVLVFLWVVSLTKERALVVDIEKTVKALSHIAHEAM